MSALRGALAGALAGGAGAWLTLHAHAIRVALEGAVCSYGAVAGLGVGLALGAASAHGRAARFASGLVAAPLAFGLFALDVKAVTGKLPWDHAWTPSVFLVEHGALGLARAVLVAGLALGGGALAAGPLPARTSRALRARRLLVGGAVAALIALVAVLIDSEAGLTAWLHLVALVPLVVLSSLAVSWRSS